MANLDIHDDTVWTNLFYLLPAAPAFGLGALPGIVVAAAGLNLFYRSGRYHTTYEREEQGGDVHAMLTYLVALIAAVLSTYSMWVMVAPVVAAPLHRRLVWSINSYIAVPAYIVVALVALAAQVGLWSIPAALLAVAGGMVKLYQPGPKTALHSLWHFFGGASGKAALWAVAVLV